MSKHTPGPWIQSRECSNDVEAPDTGHVATCEVQADACLIAAAPDLLEALQDYVRDFGDNEDGDSQRMAAKANAAIAKATGNLTVAGD